MHRDRKIQITVMLSIVVAGLVRLFYARWSVTDFWGDAYHHWLISRLTLANDWVYADYKGLETIWLPGYHYLIAGVMATWGRFNLAPAHLTNAILGTVTCGMLAWLVASITRDWRAALGAGITLALTPWHIAYSRINMPEVMAGLLLVLILLAARQRRAWWLAILALASALTRHELTLLLVVVGFWLGWQREWRAAAGLTVGAALGLGLWSAWSMHVTGKPYTWWTHYQALTAWDARFWTESGARLADLTTLRKAAQKAYPPLLLVGPATVAAALHRQWRRQVPAKGWLLIGLVGLHWSAVGLGFVAGNLPSADPRYVLVSLPVLAGAGAIVIAALPQRWIRLSVAGLYAFLLILTLSRQLPTFRDMAYVLAPERAAGEHLAQTTPGEGNLWVDAPVTIYYSGLMPGRFRSSDQLLPAKARQLDPVSDPALKAIIAHDIQFVLWEDVSYTFVQYVWPQMADGQAFTQAGYRFEPIFRFTGWELDYGARPTILWQIRWVGDSALTSTAAR